MIKRILQFLFAVSFCISANSQALTYNIIATAYVTTTISQNVVFDNTMKAGGTFTFSALAHNGGGISAPDTANVRIQFYKSDNSLVTSVNSSYSNNLPLPNSVGTPGIDTTVPWTTLTTSITLTATQASQVAYATISMYGIDGQYWAGDYGPWYRAPTFTLNSGSNLAYNPEFGPAYGYNAQGWTTSPAMGACQGAWGGSNPCIANSSGTAGQSTTGLVANANGGGPSTTGGTTSGQAGGYNNTMTVTNAGTGATSGAAPAPTVTGTTTTYTTRTVVSGSTTYVYRTPVTTTNYSDGTSTSTNGTEALYQTKVASTVTTNTISGTTLTTISTPINTVTTVGGGTTIESNGSPTTSTQTVQQGLNFQVWRYDPKNYTCVFGICAWNFTYHTPSTDRNSYGNPVNTGRTSNGIFIATNSDLPNNDNSLIGSNDGTVMRYYGTITAPITTAHPAGSVYRLYFYNNTDDGFVLRINGNTIINQNDTEHLQTLASYTSSGWMDVVAGQTYNIEAWYWNTWGAFGQTFFWDYGAGRATVPNSAFTTGTIVNYSVDTTGVSYSDPNVVNITGYTVGLGPTVDGGTITMTNSTGQEVIGSGSGSTTITNTQQSRVDTWNNSSKTYNNYLYIDQISGNNNNITVTQSGGPNRIEATLDGTGSNTLNLTQSGSAYANVNVNGYNNRLTTNQTNTGGSNYVETTINGNTNTVNHTQTGNASQLMFSTISGNNNTVTSTQTGTAQHYLNVSLTGNGHSVVSDQSGNTSNNASINLTNSGGAASVDLQQTGGKSFNFIQGCANASGCSTVIRQ